MPSSAHGFPLALSSRITPGPIQGLFGVQGIKLSLAACKAKALYPIHCPTSHSTTKCLKTIIIIDCYWNIDKNEYLMKLQFLKYVLNN